MAIPIPPPIHMVATARFESVDLSKLAALPVILAPDAPNGCPIANAPTCKFTFLESIPRSSITAKL